MNNPPDYDDDGNALYKFDGFYFDASDKYHGVKYTETYTYDEGGELDGLVNALTEAEIRAHFGEEVTDANRKYDINNDGVIDEKDVEANFTFDEYISDVDDKCTTYNKYPFRLTDSIAYYNKELPTQIVSIPFIKSDYETTIKNETDYLFAETFKTDYLGDITYKPTVDNNVRIDRGNYSAFERHLKLAEVKTLNDLAEYSNGSFFNVQKVN